MQARRLSMRIAATALVAVALGLPTLAGCAESNGPGEGADAGVEPGAEDAGDAVARTPVYAPGGDGDGDGDRDGDGDGDRDRDGDGDSTRDTDGDGLTDADERAMGTAVDLADTDGDGYDDYDEAVLRGSTCDT